MLKRGAIKWSVRSLSIKTLGRRNLHLGSEYAPSPPIRRLPCKSSNTKYISSPRPVHNMNTLPRKRTPPNSVTNRFSYTYSPLDNAYDSIRLLRLHAGPDPSWPVRCSLFHAKSSEAPSYTALSYCWGERGSLQSIFIDNETFPVTPNLKQALQRLRPQSGEDVVLWIDAICINQSDIPERSIQTSNMRSIYQNADSVAVWLGLEYKNSGMAIQFARDLTVSPESMRDPGVQEQLDALVQLFRRQYWWRIWVIQEVSCAREAIVYCGNEAISWTELDSVCDTFRREESFLLDLFYNRPSFARTLTHGGPRSLQLSRYSPGMDAPPLLELLLSHKSKKSTDPKDKVYALVGICSTRDTFGAVDYSLSVREIFSHTARHIITTSGKLDVICVKQHDRQIDLPSWVPDWTRPPPSGGALVVGLQHHEPEFTAAGNSHAEFDFVEDGTGLKASGFVLDSISIVGMPFRQKGAQKNIEPALHVLNDWWNLFAASFPEHGSSAAQAKFSRAISCGNWMFNDDSLYEQKLDAIFELSRNLLAEDDALLIDTPPTLSRNSTPMSGSVTSLLPSTSMASSVTSLVDEPEEIEDDANNKEQRSVIIKAGMTMNRRRLFISSTGLVGLAPWQTATGDLICVLLGCRFPVILRPIEGSYRLVGEAYVDGLMNGEAMAALEEGKFKRDIFQIH